MIKNTWFKLAAVSLAGIVIIFAVLWGIGEFSGYNGYNNMNMGYGYQMNGRLMEPQNMMGNGYNNMNMQGNMGMMSGMNGNTKGRMGMMGGMNGNMQGGMGMH